MDFEEKKGSYLIRETEKCFCGESDMLDELLRMNAVDSKSCNNCHKKYVMSRSTIWLQRRTRSGIPESLAIMYKTFGFFPGVITLIRFSKGSLTSPSNEKVPLL